MLVLSRKASETIVIDETITIKVLKVQGNRVRLGIETPKGMRVIRAELKEQSIDGEASRAG